MYRRRDVLGAVAAGATVPLGACLGGGCGPGETSVEDLAGQEPTGYTNDITDTVSVTGTIDSVTTDRLTLSDGTGTAVLYPGVLSEWRPSAIDQGSCTVATGYHVSNSYLENAASGDVHLYDVTLHEPS